VFASQKPAPSKAPRSTLSERLAGTRADLGTAGQAYKASLEKLSLFEEDECRRAAQDVKTRKQLLAEGLANQRDLAESERALNAAKAKLAGTRKQLREADAVIAEASSQGQLAKPSPTKAKPPVKRSKPRPAKKLPPGVKVVKYPSIITAQTSLVRRFEAKAIRWVPENRIVGSAATCVGADPCRACKNCHYCARCAKDGKTCGVCKPTH
ncbi:MAG: hypothetical protein WAU45_13665, partial [Blastocatellia bacterium]